MSRTANVVGFIILGIINLVLAPILPLGWAGAGWCFYRACKHACAPNDTERPGR